MHTLLKKIAIGFAGIVILGGVVVGSVLLWYQLAYSPHPILPHHRITITLPFAIDHEATGMRALGEVEHVHPTGHAGIDFQWEASVPITAIADGKITEVKNALDGTTPVIYVTQKMGEYRTVYKELERVENGIRAGVTVHQGDVLGYPHCTHFEDSGGHDHCQIHWEFAYNSFIPTVTNHPDRLCPLTYFDKSSLARITAIWDGVKARHADLPGFPEVCNGPFKGLDQ